MQVDIAVLLIIRYPFRINTNIKPLIILNCELGISPLVPADSPKENPYEDIELESQCSQQSLPSSPGADTTKVPALATLSTMDLEVKRIQVKTFLFFSICRSQGPASSGRIQAGVLSC